jgi:hypothetical protein
MHIQTNVNKEYNLLPAAYFHAGFLLNLFFSTLKMEATCCSETSVDTNGLYNVISQKTVLLITTAVRTSNPTNVNKN